MLGGETAKAFLEGAPPAPGADRQLVLYTWVHTAMLGDGETTLELPIDELDKGSKSLWKRYKKRQIVLEMTFDAHPDGGGGATPSTAGTSAPAASGMPAVVSRQRQGSATYEDAPKYQLGRGQSLDQILGGDTPRNSAYEAGDDGDADGDADDEDADGVGAVGAAYSAKL